MDKSRLEAPGTDYHYSIAVLGSIVAAVSGVVATIGYRGVFGLSLAIAIVSVLMIAKDPNSTERT